MSGLETAAVFVYLFGVFGFTAFGSISRCDPGALSRLSSMEFAAVCVLWPVFFVMLVVWGLSRIYSIGRKLIGD